MLDRYLVKRPRSRFWQLRIPVPKDVQISYGRKVVTRSLKETDFLKAGERAMPIVTGLRAQWDAIRHGSSGGHTTHDSDYPKEPSEEQLPTLAYEVFQRAQKISHDQRTEAYAAGDAAYEARLQKEERNHVLLVRAISADQLDRWIGPATRFLENRGYEPDPESPVFLKFLKMYAEATVEAIDRSNKIGRGVLSPVPSSEFIRKAQTFEKSGRSPMQESPFSELVAAYMQQWDAGRNNRKETNTRQQKLATFSLFEKFSSNLPMSKIGQEQAAAFYDTLRLFKPQWARIPRHKEMPWTELVNAFGEQACGLSDSTMNRHMGALKTLWDWARRRGYCQGENPFDEFRKRLKPGVNMLQYMPWEHDELVTLFSPPPKRNDLCEIMVVAMFTGMRLNEIASLTWDDVRSETTSKGNLVHYFEVSDAKTAAGNRIVPVHSALSWLLDRASGPRGERIWKGFNEKGVGNKPGADAGNEFSKFKIGKGFKDRQKTFHSFRKNVTRIMEHASVPENEWAQIIGHERGFTYATYNPDGISLHRKKELIELIEYPNLKIPHMISIR